jgi:hypothetical protein
MTTFPVRGQAEFLTKVYSLNIVRRAADSRWTTGCHTRRAGDNDHAFVAMRSGSKTNRFHDHGGGF